MLCKNAFVDSAAKLGIISVLCKTHYYILMIFNIDSCPHIVTIATTTYNSYMRYEGYKIYKNYICYKNFPPGLRRGASSPQAAEYKKEEAA